MSISHLVFESKVSSIAVVSQSDQLTHDPILEYRTLELVLQSPREETMYSTSGFKAVEPREGEREGRHDIPR